MLPRWRPQRRRRFTASAQNVLPSGGCDVRRLWGCAISRRSPVSTWHSQNQDSLVSTAARGHDSSEVIEKSPRADAVRQLIVCRALWRLRHLPIVRLRHLSPQLCQHLWQAQFSGVGAIDLSTDDHTSPDPPGAAALVYRTHRTCNQVHHTATSLPSHEAESIAAATSCRAAFGCEVVLHQQGPEGAPSPCCSAAATD